MVNTLLSEVIVPVELLFCCQDYIIISVTTFDLILILFLLVELLIAFKTLAYPNWTFVKTIKRSRAGV